MARPKGSTRIPSYRLHAASGRALVTIDGRDVYLKGKWGRTRDEARESWGHYDRVISQWLARGRVVVDTAAPGSLTVCELVAGYTRWLNDELPGKPVTILTRPVLRMLVELYGSTRAADFGPLALRALRDKMIGTTRRWSYDRGADKTLSRTYINKNVNMIRSMFRWAVEREMVPLSLHHGLLAVKPLEPGKTKAREQPEVEAVEEWVVEATIPFLPPLVQQMVRLQMATGMRSGELCRLRACDIEMSGPVWTYRPPQHKTSYKGKERAVRLGPRAQAIITPLLKPDLTAYIFNPRDVLHSPRVARAEKMIALARSIDTDPRWTTAQQKHEEWNRQTGMLKWSFKDWVWYGRHGWGERYSTRCGGQKRRPNGRLLPHYTPGAYAHAILIARRRAEAQAHRERPDVPADQTIIPHWHPHQCRHNVIESLTEKYDLAVAGSVAGHSSLKVTAGYAKRALGRVADAKAAGVMAEVG